MESSQATAESFAHNDVLADRNSPFQSECLPTALELLEVLRNEAEILKRFAGAELLRLVPKKEYLVSELEWKLQSAKEAEEGFLPASDSFKALLGEIGKLNTSNGVFIEKSLSYWQDFLSIFSPPSYGPAGKKARRQARPPKGLTFAREI
jgi:flagellar biosynthesis/type III secretory pathway chaperone